MSYIKFESSRVKEAERREKRRAREAILKKAEADYIRKKEKDERARLRGDDKWILPSLEARIKAETNKEKKKKHKKKKKKSKRKKSSSSFSDTANESEEEDEWVEKVIGTSEPVADKTCETVTAGKSHLGPSQVENGPKSVVSQEKQEKSQVSSVRDEWMTLPGLFPCLSREQLREQSRHSHKTEEQQQKDRCILDRLGQSDRELNPYWRDGGTGLPPERKDAEQVSKEARTLPVKSAGHQGVDWLHQTLEHSKEQTAKEGRSVGEIAMEQKGTLAKELKKKLDAARTALATKHREMKNTVAAAEEEEETVILTRTDSRGFVRPIQQFDQHVKPVGGRRRKQKMETHAEGKRVRYYADDDKYSLRDLFEREKLSTVEDENVMFSKLAAKGAGPNDHKYDMDDLFEEQAQLKVCDGKVKSRERGQAIREHKMIENCCWCFESKKMLKHLVVAIGSKVYLCVPPYQSLTVGHCLVVPMYHTPCATQLDEDVWSEIQTFRKTLTSMFREQLNLDVVFFETAMYLQKFPHMMMECVTLPQETGHLAPIYFKKAILECETEWTTNKKLVDLSGKDVRRAVPKGLPYFAVDFGLDSGFAHVIEDEKMFPKNFAQEIIGGMLDLDHSLWRKQRREEFDSQRKKALQFAEWWKMYDFTIRKEKDSLASEHIEA
ncbi:hypothetical protein B7P43_G07054 [Cryptotermes secundus]|uniref:CWF19-like protein 2 n=1 Tax=Cryptotermes secundus TaxID=105785 RepID=A0A2J7QLC7_9NEOP|nr:hypothetical protein B7P43_G07054 [Cryptotermes secundus]